MTELDLKFLDLSSKAAEPFCAAWHLVNYRMFASLEPGKFENCSTKIAEVGVRALIGLGILLTAAAAYAIPIAIIGGTLALGLAHKVLRAIAFALQKNGYSYIRGEALEKSLDGKAKVMGWNVCGIGGGMSLDHGGVLSWRARLEKIVEKIRKENPDVLVLQEIYDSALSSALVESLKKEFAHFYCHLGPNVWGSVGGCMVLTKCAVHDFSSHSFKNNDWTLNRGFAVLECKVSPEADQPCLRVLGTHLFHGEELSDQKRRQEQWEHIKQYVAKTDQPLPTLLVGDLNIERDGDEGKMLFPFLHHGYQDTAPTCTNRMVAQWDGKKKSVWGETIDYISLFRSFPLDGSTLPVEDQKARLKRCHLVEAFDSSYNPKTALSDHHGVAGIIEGLSRYTRIDRDNSD